MTQNVQATNGKVLPDLQAQIAALQAENERLTAAIVKKNTLSFKVSEKGALSVYGLQRFPVTLYAASWERIIDAVPSLQAFIAANAATLSRK